MAVSYSRHACDLIMLIMHSCMIMHMFAILKIVKHVLIFYCLFFWKITFVSFFLLYFLIFFNILLIFFNILTFAARKFIKVCYCLVFLQIILTSFYHFNATNNIIFFCLLMLMVYDFFVLFVTNVTLFLCINIILISCFTI